MRKFQQNVDVLVLLSLCCGLVTCTALWLFFFFFFFSFLLLFLLLLLLPFLFFSFPLLFFFFFFFLFVFSFSFVFFFFFFRGSMRWAPLALLVLAAAAQCPNRSQPCGSACCVSAEGVCCPDGARCCPHHFHCAPTALCVADDPAAYPVLPQQPAYTLCEPAAPAMDRRLPLPALAPLQFAYYGTAAVDAPSSARVAVVVMHGASRNADTYFCGMRRAVQLQTRFPPDSVLVVAPHFMHPQVGKTEQQNKERRRRKKRKKERKKERKKSETEVSIGGD